MLTHTGQLWPEELTPPQETTQCPPRCEMIQITTCPTVKIQSPLPSYFLHLPWVHYLMGVRGGVIIRPETVDGPSGCLDKARRQRGLSCTGGRMFTWKEITLVLTAHSKLHYYYPTVVALFCPTAIAIDEEKLWMMVYESWMRWVDVIISLIM